MNELSVLYIRQARYDKAEPLLVEAIKGIIQKLGLQHPHTKESIDNLIELYEAWNKPEKAQEWQAKLSQTEAKEEWQEIPNMILFSWENLYNRATTRRPIIS